MAAKKTILRKRDKDKLRQFIATEVVSPQHCKLEDNALFELTAQVCHMVRQQYPQDDMQVLHRYNYADTVDGVRINSPDLIWDENYRWQSVPLSYSTLDGHTMASVLVPIRTTIKITDKDKLAYEAACAWKKAHDLCKQKNAELRAAFYVLLDSINTLEELAVSWPEAPQILRKPEIKDPDLREAESLVQQNLCERGVLSEGCK